MKTFRPTPFVLLALTVSIALLIGAAIKTQTNTVAATTWLQALQEESVEPAEPVAKIVLKAPAKAEVGELVRFDLSDSTAQSFTWILVPESIDFIQYDGGERAAFSARKPGPLMFFISCAYEGSSAAIVHTITIVGPKVPDPVKPDLSIIKPGINADFSQWVVYWCTVNKCAKNEAAALAVSFESVAAQINAGILQRADSIITTTARANKAALGDSLSQWLPVLQELQTTMKTMASRGALSTPDQHQTLWLTIAKGLHTYAASK